MQTRNFVLAITGPTGAGKSTVSKLIAKSFERCVNIDTDRIKHMIVSGFYEDASLPAGGDFTEWELTGESIGLLAANFVGKGFDVVINGAIHKSAWEKIDTYVKITQKILILPNLDENLTRDKGRNTKDFMGAPAVSAHQEMFSSTEFYSTWQKLDTTKHTIAETVAEIISVLPSPN